MIEIVGIRPYIYDPEEGAVVNYNYRLLKEPVIVETKADVEAFELKKQQYYQRKYPTCTVAIDTMTITNPKNKK